MATGYGEACKVGTRIIEFVPGVRFSIHRDTLDAWRALAAVMTFFGYAIRQADTGGYNCRPMTGSSRPSKHALGIAVDVNWNTNPYRSDGVLVTDMPKAMVTAILAIATTSGQRVFAWGGNWGKPKDAMHFELACSAAALARGVDWTTVQQAALSTENPAAWPVLQLGDSGPTVSKLQGLLGVGVDGKFSSLTENAVLAYQRSRKLTVDGIVGAQTWTALLSDQPAIDPLEPGPAKSAPMAHYAVALIAANDLDEGMCHVAGPVNTLGVLRVGHIQTVDHAILVGSAKNYAHRYPQHTVLAGATRRDTGLLVAKWVRSKQRLPTA